MHKTKRGAESGIKAEEFDRVLFKDQWSHLWPDGDVLEIREPTIRCNQRKVASKEDFVFQKRIGILYELRRKVFGRPAGEIDIHLWLVQAD